MSTTQRVYVYLLVLLMIALGTLWHSNGKVADVRDLIDRENKAYDEVMGIGQLISDHKQLVALESAKIDSEKKGDLETNILIDLSKKHKLKTPSNPVEKTSIRRTFREKIITMDLKNEKLKNMILFMLDIEALGNSIVTKIIVNRNKDDQDLWNANITVVQRIKKEEES